MQIVWNLCAKLRHFMPKKAAIKISTRPLGFGKWWTTTTPGTLKYMHKAPYYMVYKHIVFAS